MTTAALLSSMDAHEQSGALEKLICHDWITRGGHTPARRTAKSCFERHALDSAAPRRCARSSPNVGHLYASPGHGERAFRERAAEC